MEPRTEYDTQRALILLKDLERLVQGNAPAVKLHPANSDVPCVHGDATHAGLLRMAVQLARAAILADPSIQIRMTDDGQVSGHAPAPDGAAEVLRLELVDDLPTVPNPPRRVGWFEPLFWVPLLMLATLAFAVVGLIHTATWLGAKLSTLRP